MSDFNDGGPAFPQCACPFTKLGTVRRCAIVAEKSLDEVGITAERAARAGS